MRFAHLKHADFTGFPLMPLALWMGAASLATTVCGAEPGDTRTHSEKWLNYGITETSEQTYIRVPTHDEGGRFENDGVTVWKDAEGNELARGLWVRGSLWDGTFLVSFEVNARTPEAKLIGCQQWKSGRLLKSIVPDWCKEPDDGFQIVPRAKVRITDNFSADRQPFEGWYLPSLKALKEVPLAEHVAKAKLNECYRLMVFPSFSPAYVICVEVSETSAIVRAAETDGKAGMDDSPPTKIANAGHAPLKQALVDELRTSLGRTMLFTDTREIQSRGLDGGHYVLEAVREGTYYFRDYWSPDLAPVGEALEYFQTIAPRFPRPDPFPAN